MPRHLTPIFFLAGLILLCGLILYLHHRLTTRPGARNADDGSEADTPADDNSTEECCGMHITCERDSLSTAVADPTDYFDDEELDAYAGRLPDTYLPDEIEAFRDVLLTLRPDDIAPWARAIQRRGITLPHPVRDELLMIVAEARAQRLATGS